MKQIKAIMIGAGNRGMDVYGYYSLHHLEEIKFVAVAEPIKERRDKFKKLHGISDDMCFESYEQVLAKEKFADAVFICTQDAMHTEPTLLALEGGYHVMLEKPMAIKEEDCIKMGQYAEKYGRIFLICHVLRYTSFFSSIKELLDNGEIGDLISIQHNENVGYWHAAHSFVRGNWRNEKESSPMILAKSCHDMDILLWLAGADCSQISSFGDLTHFKSDNAPKGAPKRCLDGCPEYRSCQYYAPKQYLTDNVGWPTSVISDCTSYEARKKALEVGPYGRCVYHCDNDVVDHQVVNMLFKNNVTASFTMCAFTNEISRTIKLMGTKGEIRGHMENNVIEVSTFGTGKKHVINVNQERNIRGHAGGDDRLIQNFVDLVRGEGLGEARSSAAVSVQSHLMAFAAEKARKEKRVVTL